MQVTKDVSWVGVLDPDLAVFDVVIPTKWGTTYNAYLINTDKPCLIDTVKANFTKVFLNQLEQEIDLDQISTFVVNHTEPDHSGAAGALWSEFPGLQCMVPGQVFSFKEQVKRDFDAVVVNHNDTLDLGSKRLRFIMAPFLHWPDTMFTYLEEDQILFTCDGFGSHYCDPEGRLFASETGDFTEAVKHYYDSIMSPFKPKILESVAKIRPLSISMIATGHGLILDQGFWNVVDLYEQWSSAPAKLHPKIVIGFVSAYGHTKVMADLIAAGVRSRGQFDMVLLDFGNTSDTGIKQAMADFDGLIIGSPW